MNVQILKEMGIDVWRERSSVEDVPAMVHREIVHDSFEGIQEKVSTCQLCTLHEHRKHGIAGIGNSASPKVFVVGLVLNDLSDQQTNVFRESESALLSSILYSIGISADNSYQTSIIKCATNQQERIGINEISSCLPYLHRQIELSRPKIILALGEVVAKALLADDYNNTLLESTIYRYSDFTSVLVIPSLDSMLNDPLRKRTAWQQLVLMDWA